MQDSKWHPAEEAFLIHLRCEAAFLDATGKMFVDPGNGTLSNLPTTEMTMEGLETELEMLKIIYAIFRGQSPGNRPVDLPSTMQPVIDMYAERIREIENEILERSLLV